MITELPTTITNITYELPFNETIRLCLRLENLFHQFDKTMHASTPLNTKLAMQALLKILDVTDRPDIKSKLSQTLIQYTNTLTLLKNADQIDLSRLEGILTDLQELNHLLHTSQQRLDEILKKNEFLYHVRTNELNPGGIADFRLPDFFLWQQQHPTKKSHDLVEWMSHFSILKRIVLTILKLTRESANYDYVVAENGFYHQTLNPTNPFQLARVSLPVHHNLFPEFGSGKHRLTIRFLTPNYFGNGRAEQTDRNVRFQLSFCKL